MNEFFKRVNLKSFHEQLNPINILQPPVIFQIITNLEISKWVLCLCLTNIMDVDIKWDSPSLKTREMISLLNTDHWRSFSLYQGPFMYQQTYFHLDKISKNIASVISQQQPRPPDKQIQCLLRSRQKQSNIIINDICKQIDTSKRSCHNIISHLYLIP